MSVIGRVGEQTRGDDVQPTTPHPRYLKEGDERSDEKDRWEEDCNSVTTSRVLKSVSTVYNVEILSIRLDNHKNILMKLA